MKLATVCYIRNNGKTLMMHRCKPGIDNGKWNGLGGKLGPGETPEECVVREVYEESGLRIKSPLLKGVLTCPEAIKGEDWYVFVYVATEFEGEPKTDCKEGRLEWIADSELMKLDMWEGDYKFLPYLERSGFFSARLLYDGAKLLEHSVVFYD